MRIVIVFLIAIIFSSASSSVFAQERLPSEEPFESSDIQPLFESKPIKFISPLSFRAIGLSLIDFYQKQISTRSISRCPFRISCSNYAAIAIRKKGFLIGIAYFIDRNFFRENPGMNYYYFLYKTPQGFKFDDSYYLMGNQE